MGSGVSSKVWLPIGLALGCAIPASAQIIDDDYARLALELGGLLDFESFEVLPEPGQHVDGLIFADGLTLGERFDGQTVQPAGADTPEDRVTTLLDVEALSVLAGADDRNLAIAYHAGFGSNALFPVGHRGFDVIEGRGEGTVAMLLHEPQPAIGFLVHADYPDPLGSRPPPGTVVIAFYGPNAELLGLRTATLSYGVTPLAFRSLDGPIAGIVVEPRDPGGIAIDDILYELPELTG